MADLRPRKMMATILRTDDIRSAYIHKNKQSSREAKLASDILRKCLLEHRIKRYYM